MNISRFFIDRPIFAGVLSILIFVAGAIAMFRLPISEYPEVVPPSIVVRATYPGANPKVIAETVAAPLEAQVQNRVQRALPRLPEEVRQFGVITQKSSPDLTMVVHLVSPDERYDEMYLRNYAVLNVQDVLARLPGMGQVRLFGSGDYA